MRKGEQLTLIGDIPQEINEDDLEIKEIERLIERLELAKICVAHKQYGRGENNLLLVRKDINKLIKRLVNRS